MTTVAAPSLQTLRTPVVIVRFAFRAAADLLVHRLVHARVDHHVAVRIDDLEHGSRLHARRGRPAFH